MKGGKGQSSHPYEYYEYLVNLRSRKQHIARGRKDSPRGGSARSWSEQARLEPAASRFLQLSHIAAGPEVWLGDGS